MKKGEHCKYKLKLLVKFLLYKKLLQKINKQLKMKLLLNFELIIFLFTFVSLNKLEKVLLSLNRSESPELYSLLKRVKKMNYLDC